MFMCVNLVTEVEVYVDDVGDAMLIILLEQLQNFHLCHRLNCNLFDVFFQKRLLNQDHF